MMLLSLGNLSNSISKAFFKASPVRVNVALSFGLRVNLNTVLSISVLWVGEEGDLQSASDSGIWQELDAELSGEILLHAIGDSAGILSVASASAVVNEDVVGGRLTASEFLRSFSSHCNM